MQKVNVDAKKKDKKPRKSVSKSMRQMEYEILLEVVTDSAECLIRCEELDKQKTLIQPRLDEGSNQQGY